MHFPFGMVLEKFFGMQSPGLRKDRIWEENLKAILCGKDGVGMPEVNKILSPQFNDSSLRNMEMERQKDIRSSVPYPCFSITLLCLNM